MRTYAIALAATLLIDLQARADTLHQILPALAAAQVAFHENDESRATLAGTDANGDGIRDDVGARIDSAYAVNTYLRDQTRVIARSYQQIVAESLSPSQVQSQLARIEQAQDCIATRGTEPGGGSAFLLQHQLNTYQRSKAFLEAARRAHSNLGLHGFTPCD